MENKSLFLNILLGVVLVGGYFYAADKIENLEAELAATSTFSKSGGQTMSEAPEMPRQNPMRKSADNENQMLDSLNRQLVETRTRLHNAEEKLRIKSAEAAVLKDEMKRMRDARGELQKLEKAHADLSAGFATEQTRIDALETTMRTQNADLVKAHIARIEQLKNAYTGVAVSGAVLPVFGLATLVSYAVEEVENYCRTIENMLTLERQTFGEIVSLNAAEYEKYQNQCAQILKDEGAG